MSKKPPAKRKPKKRRTKPQAADQPKRDYLTMGGTGLVLLPSLRPAFERLLQRGRERRRTSQSPKMGRQMTDNAKTAIRNALDELALVLVDQGHIWTRAERRSYEAAIRLLSQLKIEK